MKHLKLFENFLILERDEGDMVYVDMYGPRTFGFSSSSPSGLHIIKNKKLPFRPVIHPHYDFNKDTKYEIVNLDGNTATLFDDNNEPFEININHLYDEKISADYIKDCFTSSFEDMFEQVDYKVYINEVVITVNTRGHADTLSNSIEDKEKFEGIFEQEFKPRLEDDGYKVSKMIFSSARDFSLSAQIYVRL